MAKRRKKKAARAATADNTVLQKAFESEVMNLYKVYLFAFRDAEGDAGQIAAAGDRFVRGLTSARTALANCVELSET